MFDDLMLEDLALHSRVRQRGQQIIVTARSTAGIIVFIVTIFSTLVAVIMVL